MNIRTALAIALSLPLLSGSNNPAESGNCRAFIATGSHTADGKILMGHNSGVDYIVGERWNIIADIVPEHGNRIFMDSHPGFIHSGDDFVENAAGMLITETTITQFKGFDEGGITRDTSGRNRT